MDKQLIKEKQVSKSHNSTRNNKTSLAQQKRNEQDKINRAIDMVVEQHMEAFKELEYYDMETKPRNQS